MHDTRLYLFLEGKSHSRLLESDAARFLRPDNQSHFASRTFCILREMCREDHPCEESRLTKRYTQSMIEQPGGKHAVASDQRTNARSYIGKDRMLRASVCDANLSV